MLTIMYNARSLHWFICRNFSGLFFFFFWCMIQHCVKGGCSLNKRAVWFSGSVYFLFFYIPSATISTSTSYLTCVQLLAALVVFFLESLWDLAEGSPLSTSLCSFAGGSWCVGGPTSSLCLRS